MLHLATFCGRKVSEVNLEQNAVIKFSDFLIEFFVEVSFNNSSFRDLIGEQLLYIKKMDDLVSFHFTSDLCLSIDLQEVMAAPCDILVCKNKSEESLIKTADISVFDNI